MNRLHIFFSGILLFVFYKVLTKKDIPEIAIFSTSSTRKDDAFYLNKMVNSLLSSGFPKNAIMIYNTEKKGVHKKLEMWNNNMVSVLNYQRDVFGQKSFRVSPSNKLFRSEHLKEAGQDSADRITWRMNENIDFVISASLALKKFSQTEWFLFLEDDVVVIDTKGFMYDLKRALVFGHVNGIVWMGKDTSWLSKAVLMHRDYLESFVDFVKLHYDTLPLDWLLTTFEETLGHQISKRAFVKVFTHIGKNRSFKKND